MNKTKVAIVGLGTVGSGVARLLLDHGDRTARHAGRTLWLEQAVVRDLSKQRDAELPSGILSDDLAKITSDPEIQVVAQLVGGLSPAREIMLELLESGKDVVTANKALLAEHGPELFDRARELGRSIAFEASVAGGIPIIANISQCLSANQVSSLTSILNGTSNYILTRMAEGISFSEAVSTAQDLGLAEADPTMDVDGTDAAQKLSILAHLAFGARVHWRQISRRGINDLAQQDVDFADQLGFQIKLLAVARAQPDGLELFVGPTLVPNGTPIAEVRGEYNAISVAGDAVGNVFFHGPGAGRMPTASAVVADMIDTAVGRTRITFQTLEFWSDQPPRILPASTESSRYKFYLRFSIQDSPGILGRIAGILGEHQISIATVTQHSLESSAPNASVPLVIMTHEASEAKLQAALQKIDQLSVVCSKTECLRVMD